MRFVKSLIAMSIPAFLMACGSTSQQEVVEVPTDLPEICQGIDFVAQPDMREVCGVRSSRYKSYKNIALQRYLIVPKGASVVKTGDKIELRLPNTMPIPLPNSMAYDLKFDQETRLEYIKNKMTYKELFPAGQERIKMFKLEIPLDNGTSEDLCFNVPENNVDDRKRTRMANRIESLSCEDFENIVAKYGK